jgi:phosphoglycolate phosphatase-like HAD superfamily hydrolase
MHGYLGRVAVDDPTTVVLDIDGTLVDTNYQHAIAWHRAFCSRDYVVQLWEIHRHIGMRTKPHPDLVHAALEKVACDGPAVMVGDSTWDVKAAEAAGMPTLAVLTGGFSEAELREAGAAEVFESIGELRKDRQALPRLATPPYANSS